MDPLTRLERNKKECKNYREKNREEYRKRDAERKPMAKMAEKLTKPAVSELKKKAERERLRMYRQKQKLGLISTKQTSARTEVSLQEEGRESSSFSNKQSKHRRLSTAEKAFAIESQQANRSGWSTCQVIQVKNQSCLPKAWTKSLSVERRGD